jgi:hypothetical protein
MRMTSAIPGSDWMLNSVPILAAHPRQPASLYDAPNGPG